MIKVIDDEYFNKNILQDIDDALIDVVIESDIKNDQELNLFLKDINNIKQFYPNEKVFSSFKKSIEEDIKKKNRNLKKNKELSLHVFTKKELFIPYNNVYTALEKINSNYNILDNYNIFYNKSEDSTFNFPTIDIEIFIKSYKKMIAGILDKIDLYGGKKSILDILKKEDSKIPIIDRYLKLYCDTPFSTDEMFNFISFIREFPMFKILFNKRFIGTDDYYFKNIFNIEDDSFSKNKYNRNLSFQSSVSSTDDWDYSDFQYLKPIIFKEKEKTIKTDNGDLIPLKDLINLEEVDDDFPVSEAPKTPEVNGGSLPEKKSNIGIDFYINPNDEESKIISYTDENIDNYFMELLFNFKNTSYIINNVKIIDSDSDWRLSNLNMNMDQYVSYDINKIIKLYKNIILNFNSFGLISENKNFSISSVNKILEKMEEINSVNPQEYYFVIYSLINGFNLDTYDDELIKIYFSNFLFNSYLLKKYIISNYSYTEQKEIYKSGYINDINSFENYSLVNIVNPKKNVLQKSLICLHLFAKNNDLYKSIEIAFNKLKYFFQLIIFFKKHKKDLYPLFLFLISSNKNIKIVKTDKKNSLFDFLSETYNMLYINPYDKNSNKKIFFL